ncbi:rod shape-determining protein RodA [bacterium]|nr:rod shape-determining protein RodA [bacterium]
MSNYQVSMKKSSQMNVFSKFLFMNWKLILLLLLLSSIGLAILYSAGKAECTDKLACLISYGSWSPWAISQLPKIIVGFIILFVIAVFDLKIWVKYAYWIYGIGVISLVLVSFIGHIGMGAQRWLNLGFIRFQPSEFMKIALVLALSKYFAALSINEIRSNYYLVFPAFLVALPVGLVLTQPDLGTAMTLLFVSAIVFFIAGVQWWKFGVLILIGIIALPVVWKYGLHDYQKQRIIIFMNPEKDIMGSGYHITQSKISLGSGGFFGKGYLQGTQSHLNFLPEKQTDFIFTMFAEEFGMFGCLILFAVIIAILYQCYRVAFASRNNFGKLLSLGLGANFFVYFFINTAMVMGLLPVVGVPSPLLSYGGTAMLTLFFGFGLIECSYIHSDMLISSKSNYL